MELRKHKHVLQRDNAVQMAEICKIAKLPPEIHQLLELVALVMDDVAAGRDSFVSIGGTRKKDAVLLTVQLDGERGAEGMGGLQGLDAALLALLGS